MIVGRGLTKTDALGSLVPLSLGKKPSAYLRVLQTLQMDDEGEHLAASRATTAVYADEAGRHMLCHYDYARVPSGRVKVGDTWHRYPDPHFQVEGESEALRMIAERRQVEASSLRDLHFPVGGRRFRPSLEDVIEMLVVERIAEARDGWQDVIQRHREGWQEKQLKAAVRRWPEWAAEELRQHGYEVKPPPEE